MPTSRFLRFLLPVLALALLGMSAMRSASATALPAEDGRVLVLGFDGADGRTVDAMMKEGELPNLKRLAEMGSFHPLGTTTAAESPVAWASINTGQNPGKTGIPGFVKRGFTSSGIPVPAGGHQTSDPLEREDFEMTGILKWLGAASPMVVAGVAGGAALLLFLLVFAGLLRLRFGVSLVLATLLAAVGGYGALAATKYLPNRVPGNVRKTNPVDPEALAMWEVAGRAGKRAVVLDAAMAWDRPAIDGVEVLGGLGLPDSRGDNGAWFIYTDSPNEIDAPPNGRSRGLTSGEVFKVRLRPNRLETKIYGIENFWLKEQVESKVDLIEAKLGAPEIGFQESMELQNAKDELLAQLEADNGRVTLPLIVDRAEDGQSAKVRIGDEEQTLKEGEWSDFYRLDFELNPLLRSRAITRVKIMSMNEPFQLFVSMLDIDPEYPPFWQPVSQPNMFSR
ncbi:MAG: alkaline phosphatase family protein, partial [Planctomycetota bacterium]